MQACGQNSGESAPADNAPATSSNRLPVVSVPATLEYLSGDTVLVVTATASDADGDTVKFSLSGADAAQFSISSAGAVSFVQPPRFIEPLDTGKKNQYEILVVASDSIGSASAGLVVEVVDAVLGLAGPPTLKRARVVLDQSFQLNAIGAEASVDADAAGYFRVRRGTAERNKPHVLYTDGGYSSEASSPIQFSLFSRLPADPVIEKIRLTPISMLLFTLKDAEKAELLKQLGLRKRAVTGAGDDFWQEFELDEAAAADVARINLKVDIAMATGAALLALNNGALSLQESLDLAKLIAQRLLKDGPAGLTSTIVIEALLGDIAESSSLEKDFAPEKLEKIASVMAALNQLLSDEQVDPASNDAQEIFWAGNNRLAKKSAALIDNELDPATVRRRNKS